MYSLKKTAMKELTILTLALVASVQCLAIKSEHQSHHQHSKGKDGTHMGFFGSRGKRSINSDITAIDNNIENSENGLKEWPLLGDSLFEVQRDIRAPKGFFGMRGKKNIFNDEKRALLGIQQNLNGLRDRTRFIEAQGDEEYQPFNPKRAPVQGFFGVRGKKFGDYDLNGNMGEKRAPKGFLGMRGKKSGENIDDEMDDQQFDYVYNSLFEKRIPSGFTGVRGKKDLVSDDGTH